MADVDQDLERWLLAGARSSPDGSHLAYVEVEGHDQPRFTGGRTVMVNVPFADQAVVLAEGAGVVDWPVGWLDGETPIPERLNAEGHLGLWVADESSEPGDLPPSSPAIYPTATPGPGRLARLRRPSSPHRAG